MTTTMHPPAASGRQTPTWRSRMSAAVGLLSALAALTAPPALLTAAIGSPLPALPVDWAAVVDAVQGGLVPPSVWVNVLAVVAWATWITLVGMLLLEVVAVARNRPSRAGVPGWIRHLAQALVAAVIVLVGPGQQAALAFSAPGPPAMVSAAAGIDVTGRPSVTSVPVSQGRLVDVAEADSWSGFAADVLGDPSLGPALRAANLGRQVGDGHTIAESTAFVEPGWQLLIPTELAAGREPAADDADGASSPGSDAAEARTWAVERGDHFWAIAETTLVDAWGRAPTDAEIDPYWRQLVAANRDALLPPGDPDVIYPGQQFVVPPPPPEPAAADPSTTDDAAPAPSATPEPDPPDATADEPETPSAVTPPTPPPGDGWRAAIEDHTPADPDAPAATDVDGDERTAMGVPVGLPAGLAATGLIAAGVVAVLRWRRRSLLQDRAPGLRLPTPLPDTGAEIAKLDAAAASEKALDDLASLLASIPFDVHPVLVSATDDGDVTLLFDEGAELPEPPAPWTVADDGVDGPIGWRARLGDRGPERSFGLPLLVTLGRTGASTILANVGAMGTLTLDGARPTVRRRLRAMTLDLATSRVSYPVEVVVTGDERLASLDRVRQVDQPSDEIDVALAEADVVIDDRIPRLLVCHDGTQPPAIPDELLGIAGAVTAARPPGERWILDLEDDHTGRLRLPDGGTVQLALPDLDPELLDDELDRLDQPTSLTPATQLGEVAPCGDVDPTTNGHHAAPAARPRTDPAWCEVRLLGPIEVVRDGIRVEGLTPVTLEILAYLATHPAGVTKERLDDVIWGGAAPRPGSQRVTAALTKLRKLLGDGPDGQPLVPRRSMDEPIVLSEHVGTDADRAFGHLAVAGDLPAELRSRELAAALELMRGEPLEGRAYSWATDICERAIVHLQDAAVEVARACREADEYEAAERAIDQGLKLLDANGHLYLERAALARQRGRAEQVPRIFEHYRRKLADDADEIAGTVTTPPPEIELAFRELMASA
jgi:DNA-binding SARP family transcriptional activator